MTTNSTPAQNALEKVAAGIRQLALRSDPSHPALTTLADDLDAGGTALIGTNLVAVIPPEIVLPDSTKYRNRLTRTLELIRDVLVFCPVLVTWWQLRYALNAYNQAVTAAQARHQLADSFLLGWVRGFDGRTWPLALSALIVALLIAAIIALTLVAHFLRDYTDRHNSREEDRATLAGLLAESTLLLTRIRRSGTSTFTDADIESMVRGFYENSDGLTKALHNTSDQIKRSLESGPASLLQQAIREWEVAASALTDLGQSLTMPAEVTAKLEELERQLAATSLRLTGSVNQLVDQLAEQTLAAGQEAAAHTQMARDVSIATHEVGRAFDTFTARLEQLGGLVGDLREAIDQTRMAEAEEW